MPNQDSVTINGVTITLEQVVKFAPAILFHPDERYLPVSIDDLLATATLVDDSTTPPTTVLQPPLTQAQLQSHSEDRYRLRLAASTYAGQPLGQATMYVAPQVPSDGSYVDLNFFFLTAFNGCQMIKFYLDDGSFICITKQQLFFRPS